MYNKMEIYVKPNGQMPFVTWLESLDKAVRYRIKVRLDRVVLGNLGDHKQIAGSIWELRLFFGAGYRIYFAKQAENIILLLCGGDKSNQHNDIKQAIRYWHDYLTR